MKKVYWIAAIVIPVVFGTAGMFVGNGGLNKLSSFDLESSLASMSMWVPIGIIISMLGLVIWGVYLFEKKRTEALQQIATRLGFQFNGKGEGRSPEQFSNFAIFNRGREMYGSILMSLSGGRGIRNIMTGHYQDLSVEIMDFQYTRLRTRYSSRSRYGMSRRRTETVKQTVFIIQNPGNLITNFTVAPEGFLDKYLNWGGQSIDINIPSRPNFSSSYKLVGASEELVRRLFTGPVIEYFERNKTDWIIECRPEGLAFYQQKSWFGNFRMKPEEIENSLNRFSEIVKLLLSSSAGSGPGYGSTQQAGPSITGDVTQELPKQSDDEQDGGSGDIHIAI